MISTTTKKEQMEVFLILLFRAQDNPTPQLHKAKCYVPLIVMDSLSCSCFHVSKHKISQENNDISISYKNVSKYSKKQSYSPQLSFRPPMAESLESIGRNIPQKNKSQQAIQAKSFWWIHTVLLVCVGKTGGN